MKAVPAEPRRREADEPGGVRLGEDLGVLALVGPEAMQHHPERTMTFVLLDIEEPLRIARPDHFVGGVDDKVAEIFASLEVADADGQHFGADLVEAPGEFRVIRRMTGCGATKERLVLGARVAVDQNRLLPALPGSAAVNSVLAAGAKARIIGPGPVDLRGFAVVLFDPRPHLADEFLLQLGGRREQRIGVSVLRLEQRADVRRQVGRVAQHLAPVFGSDPGVFVGPGRPVRQTGRWANVGARRRRMTGARGAIGHAKRSGTGFRSA